jgi:Ca2+-binding EF-hand superfamily protein
MHLTGPEFLILLRTAFSFLGVTIPGDAIDEIFAITDVDRDGTISYTEYFKFIETYICDFQTPHHEDKQAKLQKRGSLNSLETCEMLRRFRRLLWG